VLSARDEAEAVDILKQKRKSVNAIIWTINYMGFHSFESIKSIKSMDDFKELPVLIISKFTDKKYIIKAIEVGAVEYIVRPFDQNTVVRKICRLLGIVVDKTIQWEDEDDIIIFNFAEMFNREIKAASRGEYKLSVMLGILLPDKPEEEDDRGDKLIGIMRSVIKNCLRETDSVFHYGKNNLIILLPFAGENGAEAVAKKLHEIFDTNTVINKNRNGFSLATVHVTYPGDGKIKERLLEELESRFGSQVMETDNED